MITVKLYLMLRGYIGRINNKRTRKAMKKDIVKFLTENTPKPRVEVRKVTVDDDKRTLSVDVWVTNPVPRIPIRCVVKEKDGKDV